MYLKIWRISNASILGMSALLNFIFINNPEIRNASFSLIPVNIRNPILEIHNYFMRETIYRAPTIYKAFFLLTFSSIGFLPAYAYRVAKK